MYQLVFCDKELSYEDHREMFCIGIYSSFDKAKETAEDYLQHVVNIIESHCFEQEDAARGHMLTMQQNYDRMRWSVSRYVTDQCLWKEGFIRA